jgi:hypothetical protein
MEYKRTLKNYLELFLSGWEVESDEDGDIQLTIPEYSELHHEYSNFLGFLEKLPEIDYPREMTNIYITDGKKTYKHIINPTPEYIESLKRFNKEI